MRFFANYMWPTTQTSKQFSGEGKVSNGCFVLALWTHELQCKSSRFEAWSWPPNFKVLAMFPRFAQGKPSLSDKVGLNFHVFRVIIALCFGLVIQRVFERPKVSTKGKVAGNVWLWSIWGWLAKERLSPKGIWTPKKAQQINSINKQAYS